MLTISNNLNFIESIVNDYGLKFISSYDDIDKKFGTFSMEEKKISQKMELTRAESNLLMELQINQEIITDIKLSQKFIEYLIKELNYRVIIISDDDLGIRGTQNLSLKEVDKYKEIIIENAYTFDNEFLFL